MVLSISKNPTESEILNNSLNNDLTNLENKKLLPKEWLLIKEININPQSETAKQWVISLQPKININKNGTLRLNLQILDGTDRSDNENPNTTILTQLDLIDLKTNNKIWEITRTYQLTPSSY